VPAPLRAAPRRWHARRRAVALSALLSVTLVATTVIAAPQAFADRSTRAEQRLLSLMERDRAAAGVPSWGRAEDLTSAAVRWSARLADEYGSQGGHRHNPNLSSEVCCSRRLAENVGWADGSDGDLDAAIDRLHAAFMGSDGHRANVLHPRHTHVGVGVELHGSGNLYVTVVFREPDGTAPAAAPSGSDAGGTTATPEDDPGPSHGASTDHTPQDPATTADASQPASAAAAPDDASTATSDSDSAAAGTGPSSSPASDELDDLAARDPDELVRLAAWVLAEYERRVEQDARRELEELLATLGAAPAKLVDALRRALELVLVDAPPGDGRPTPAA
jgi:uncharacterized protein YkwD